MERGETFEANECKKVRTSFHKLKLSVIVPATNARNAFKVKATNLNLLLICFNFFFIKYVVERGKNLLRKVKLYQFLHYTHLKTKK